MSLASNRSPSLLVAHEACHAYCFPPFRLDLVHQQLWRDGELVFLKPRAFAVLRYLLEHAHRLVTKAELLDHVWSGIHVIDGVLKTQLSDIRVALGDSASTPRFIETVHGQGYRFIGRVRLEPATPTLDEVASTARPFVGREQELSTLRAAFASASAGRRQLVFVAGAAGIGKTSLVETFVDDLVSGARAAVARGQCVNQYGGGEAYLPLLEALVRIARGHERSALATALRRHAPSWLSHLPGLLDDPHAVVQPATGSSVAPERMLREMAEALEAFASDRPLVLLFEDVHWADPSTLAWLAYIARRPDPTRLLLLATYRPRELDALAHPLGAVKRELALQQRCHEIALPSFVREDIDVYLSRRFGAHHFPSAFAQLSMARTGGSPLLLAKLLDYWIECGWIRQGKSGARLEADLDTLRASAPASIVALIESEIDRLTPSECMLIEGASVAGFEFSAASVAAALEQDLVSTEESCLRLARRGEFIRLTASVEWPDGTLAAQFEFIHELYRQTMYERAGTARRSRLHQRVGERQEAAYGERAKDIAAELALHFQRGGDRQRAVSYWKVAGDQALGRSAYRQAIDCFEQALALLAFVQNEHERMSLELELQLSAGGALGMTLGHAAAEVERRYARARQLCQDIGETQRLEQTLPGLLIFHLVRGEYHTVCDLGRSCSLEAQPRGEPGNFEANVVVGVAQAFMGELEEARARLTRALTLYESSRWSSGRVQLLDSAAVARTLAGVTLWLLGFPDQALRLQEEALALGERSRDPCVIALASATRALVLQLRGESRELLERARAGIAHCEKHGFIYYLLNLRLLSEVSAAAEHGDWRGSLQDIKETWRALRATGSEFGDTRLRSLVALAHARGGLEAEAFQLLNEALEQAEAKSERFWQPELYRMLGELALQAGLVPAALAVRWRLPQSAPACAEACFVRALEVARRMHAKSLELRAASALARFWQQRRRAEDAQQLLRGIYRWFDEGFSTADVVEARQLLLELTGAADGAPGTYQTRVVAEP